MRQQLNVVYSVLYISCYESHEESTKNADTVTDIKFMNVQETKCYKVLAVVLIIVN